MNTTLFLLIRLSTNLDLFFQVLVIVQPFESFFQSSPYRPNQYYLPTCPCLQWCSSCCRCTSPTLVPGINSLLHLLILFCKLLGLLQHPLNFLSSSDFLAAFFSAYTCKIPSANLKGNLNLVDSPAIRIRTLVQNHKL